MTFVNIISSLLAATAFVACIILLASVITDLARDQTLGGWAKAIWLVFLIFVPFLTVFVYVVVRGDGMAERAAKQMEQEKTAVDSYIRDVAGQNPAQEIEAAKRLLDAGTLTEEEFNALKQRALA
ncbi:MULTISPECIES: SHOCT domain-containing protein [Actibacterium]|uniref:Na+-translocating ferredoxin:NAD+ oxidoreductase RnfE subunit n=1 Tax=Actibacterium naphthalenivorans TaxID=1614693 RepID=A0A840CM86_9RHOB|nr:MULTISPECIES: SHOCT domain-containing protein [Actibacterium]ALG90851.1 membrane protein [Actibacterium sp. EMB200-NS6]MBB4023846.1 Na+-translocating ferredoxin:NAD+ oxidoreductase RnfE subunit [Actibacterium naphthalenivorans]